MYLTRPCPLSLNSDVFRFSFFGCRFVYCRMCNLASQKSVRDFVDSFEEAQVHGLVNNAGTMEAPRSFSADGVEVHLAVNHIGHFLLTNLLLDRLKVAAAAATSTDDTPRIVFLMNLDYRCGAIPVLALSGRISTLF